MNLIVDRPDNERRAPATTPTILALCAAWPPRRPRQSWARAPLCPPPPGCLRRRFGRGAGQGEGTAAHATVRGMALPLGAHDDVPDAPRQRRAPRCLRHRFAGAVQGRGESGAAPHSTFPRGLKKQTSSLEAAGLPEEPQSRLAAAAANPHHCAKYPLMSMIRSVAPRTNTLMAPPCPAGTRAALATISPERIECRDQGLGQSLRPRGQVDQRTGRHHGHVQRVPPRRIRRHRIEVERSRTARRREVAVDIDDDVPPVGDRTSMPP